MRTRRLAPARIRTSGSVVLPVTRSTRSLASSPVGLSPHVLAHTPQKGVQSLVDGTWHTVCVPASSPKTPSQAATGELPADCRRLAPVGPPRSTGAHAPARLNVGRPSFRAEKSSSSKGSSTPLAHEQRAPSPQPFWAHRGHLLGGAAVGGRRTLVPAPLPERSSPEGTKLWGLSRERRTQQAKPVICFDAGPF